MDPSDGVQIGPTLLGFDVFVARPVGEVYAYLSDPRNRPEWQSSLRSVELLDDGEPREGMRWIDHTKVGLSFHLEITGMQDLETWAEAGRIGRIHAVVVLEFEERSREGRSGTQVTCMVAVRGRGWARPLGWPATAVGTLLARPDLKRAARILETKGG